MKSKTLLCQNKYDKSIPKRIGSVSMNTFDNLLIWIKKFSSPKIKIWFEPMFFSEFFCGFERCGFAVFLEIFSLVQYS